MKEKDFIQVYNEEIGSNITDLSVVKKVVFNSGEALFDFVGQCFQHQKILDEYRSGNIKLPETIMDHDNGDGWPYSSKALISDSSPKPHCCPVCHGNGKVPNGFYNQVGGHGGTSDITPEKCQSCDGKGVIWG